MAGPQWWRRAVIYQVYLRSFQDSDGDGVGDLRGLVDRLDYLNDGTAASLGVDAIWVSPVSRAGDVDFGYDVIDYETVDPRIGDLGTFDLLVRECHARGMRVILDLVLNHTSARHPWFLESRGSRESAKRAWYIWRDPAPDGAPPNNWQSVFGGSMWSSDEATGQYYLHSYFPGQPDLNWRHPPVVDAMHDVLRFWLRRGVDGVRLDAVARLLKDESFADDPPASGDAHARQSANAANKYLHPGIEDVMRGIRRVVDEFPARVSIGEVYAPPEEFAPLYGGASLDGLHLVFNFGLVRSRPHAPLEPWDAGLLARVVQETEAALPPGAQSCLALSNHDVPRFATRHGDDGRGGERARAAALVLLALRGTPCIYYGDELGMVDVSVQGGAGRDAIGRDAQRSPMPWRASSGRGFTRGTAWLPLGDASLNVAAQASDPRSTLSLYRRALWTRKRERSLLEGTVFARAEGGVCLIERRAADARPVLVAVNTTTETQRRSVSPGFDSVLLSSAPAEAAVTLAPAGGACFVTLPPLVAAWLTSA